MKSFGKYFWYHFKATVPRFLVLAVLGIILTFSFVFYEERSYYSAEYYIDQTIVYISTQVLGWIAGICATVIPFFELSGFKNRRNMDTLLFFPVSRTKMAFAHWLNGLLHILTVSAICFIITACTLLRYSYIYPIWAMIPYFALLMLASAAVYSLFSFIFMQANTVADGVVFVFAYALIGILLAEYAEEFVKYPVKFNETWFTPYSSLGYVVNSFENFITPSLYYIEGVLKYSVDFIWSYEETFVLSSWCLVGAASLFGYLFCFARQKPQKIGDISDSAFGYKTLIPLTCFPLIIMNSIESDAFSWVTLIAMVVGYIIFRRGFKFKLFDVIFIVAAFVTSVGALIF